MKLKLLVIRTAEPELLKAQYELLGFNFDYHRHGNGPLHYSVEVDGLVFEIYPLLKSMEKADHSTRLGFVVDELPALLNQIRTSNWKIRSEITETAWGITAVIQDLDGRKVELSTS